MTPRWIDAFWMTAVAFILDVSLALQPARYPHVAVFSEPAPHYSGIVFPNAPNMFADDAYKKF